VSRESEQLHQDDRKGRRKAGVFGHPEMLPEDD
jgi:hypothetical protein